MLDVPAPPVFHGEQGKDDLPEFLHGLRAWYHTTKSACGLNAHQLFELITYQAFPYRSNAYNWFNTRKSQILAEARANMQDPNAVLTCTVKAVSEDFDYLNGDKESKLYSMELQAGENIATFVMHFCGLAREIQKREETALYKLIPAVSMNAPDYAQALEAKVIDQTATLEEAEKLAWKYTRHRALRGNMPVLGCAKSDLKHVRFGEPDVSHRHTVA